MTSTHQKFLAQLDASHEAVWKVARWISSYGRHVWIPATSRAPTREEWREHSDGGDLMMAHPATDPPSWDRCEVKHLSVDFTCREDWPFGDKFIVDAKRKFDRADPRPKQYFIVNKHMTHCAMVKDVDPALWTVEERTSRWFPEEPAQPFYFAPLEQVAFREMAGRS